MKTLFWDKNKHIYITAAVAYAQKMFGVERHHLVDVDDLVNNNGLPNPAVVNDNSIFYMPIKGNWIRVISPRNEKPNKFTLEPWAGKVVLAENNSCRGVVDAISGALIVPYNKDNQEIYPINEKFYVIVNKDEYKSKIVDNRNRTIDEVIGSYEKKNNKLLKRLKNATGEKEITREWTVELLNKYELISDLDEQLNLVIKEYKQFGYGLPAIYDKLMKFFDDNMDKNKSKKSIFDVISTSIINNDDCNACTLEDWSDEISLIDIDGSKGAMDVESGKFIITPDSSNIAIYPISKDYFVIQKKDEKIIVDTNNHILDRLNGEYVFKVRADGRKELLRKLNTNDGMIRIDKRWTINSLERESSVGETNNNFKDIVKQFKDNGINVSVLYDKIKNAYHNIRISDDVM